MMSSDEYDDKLISNPTNWHFDGKIERLSRCTLLIYMIFLCVKNISDDESIDVHGYTFTMLLSSTHKCSIKFMSECVL